MGRGKGEGGEEPRTLKDASRMCRRRAPQKRGREGHQQHTDTHTMAGLGHGATCSPLRPVLARDGGLQTGARRHLHVTLTGFQAEAGAWPYSLWSSDAKEGKASLPSQDRPPEPPTQPSPALACL